MAKIFYLSEIVKFAIEKEQESFDFYKALAEKEENAEIKSVFETLKLEEQQHEAFYKGMLNTVTEEQTPRVHEDEEYAVYMQTLIDASRQQSPRTAAEFSDTKVAIDYAIGREKDSIIFYAGLKNLILEKDQTIVDTIIREEAKHAAKLIKLKEQL